MSRTTQTDIYRIEVPTVSIDAITDAIERVITELHTHKIVDERFTKDISHEVTTMQAVMGHDIGTFQKSVRKLRNKIVHLEKWSELHPRYVFRATDLKNECIEEYIVSFESSPVLQMIVERIDKGLSPHSPETHTSYSIDLHKQPEVFTQYLSKAFELIGVAVLAELLII